MGGFILNYKPNKYCSWDLNQGLFGIKAHVISSVRGNEGKPGVSQKSFRETAMTASASLHVICHPELYGKFKWMKNGWVGLI